MIVHFAGDATWWLREEWFYEKTLNLEAVNYPDYFLRHQNYQLKISKNDNTDLFKKDSSFSSEFRGTLTIMPVVLSEKLD